MQVIYEEIWLSCTACSFKGSVWQKCHCMHFMFKFDLLEVCFFNFMMKCSPGRLLIAALPLQFDGLYWILSWTLFKPFSADSFDCCLGNAASSDAAVPCGVFVSILTFYGVLFKCFALEVHSWVQFLKFFFAWLRTVHTITWCFFLSVTVSPPHQLSSFFFF